MGSPWKGSPEAFESRYFRSGPVELQPKPVVAPGVPIVIGGHSEVSARRAARLGDGFFLAVLDAARVAALREVIALECEAVNRNQVEIELTALPGGDDPRAVEAMAAVGVSRLLSGYGMGGAGTPDDIERWLGDFAARFIDVA